MNEYKVIYYNNETNRHESKRVLALDKKHAEDKVRSIIDQEDRDVAFIRVTS